jgi:wyosine [tRNA(Phe)-imidazoG37] synthetase (radical SAM superfamily)
MLPLRPRNGERSTTEPICSGTPLEPTEGLKMDCIINSSMYIRSNGNVVCWDDSGCNKVLQAFDKDVDYAKDVYLGRPYNEIRTRLKANILPHGDICTACHLLNPQNAFNNSVSSQKVLQFLQVESSFACQVSCPNCYPGVRRRDAISKTAGGHLNLGLDAYKTIVESLARGGVDIREIVFEGHGEPLLNPRIWDMIRYTKELYPSAWIRVVTNGNFKFRADMALSGVSHMVFSIDGANKSSYDKYRVDGNFSLCEAFMKEFCEYASLNNIALRTTWKYILFDHNDSADELEKLARNAEKFGLTDVLLTITQVGPSSSRFFRALSDAWELCATNSNAAELMQSLHGFCDVSLISSKFKQLIKWSPFPEIMEQRPGRFMVASFTPLAQANDGHVLNAERALGLAMPIGSNDRSSDEGIPFEDSVNKTKSMGRQIANVAALAGPQDDEEGKESRLLGAVDSEAAALALMSYATKLRRLYGEKTQLLVTSHYKLACRAMELLPLLPVDSRGEIAAMLSGFVRNSIESSLPQTQLLVPVMHLNEIKYGLYEVTGDDPIFVLYAERLKMPMGKVQISYSALIIEGDLRDPELFFDMGEGFNAIQSFDLGRGPLADCNKVLFLPNGVRRLRFDPCRSEGKFQISNFRITGL